MTKTKTTLPAKKAASTAKKADASYSGNMSLSMTLSPEPVSYTHLTLPTICSV